MDFKARLEREFLPVVTKPARFLGNEYNTIKKKLSEVELRIALCYPAIYEQGMADLNFEILYYLFNSHPVVYAERFFAPSQDALNILKQKNIPLFSLESKTALSDFHLIFFTIQLESQYIDLLNILGSGNIPISVRERNDNFPLVIGGGILNWNPEPIADFLDVALIGNYAQAALPSVELILQAIKHKQSRAELVNELGKLKGVYIPGGYQAIYNGFGEFSQLQKTNESLPMVIESITSSDISSLKSYSIDPLFPLIRTDCSPADYDYTVNTDLESDLRKQLQAQESTEMQALLMDTANTGLIWKGIKDQIFMSNQKLHFSFPDFAIVNQEPVLQQFDFLKGEEICIFATAGSPRLRTVTQKYYRDEDLLRLISLLVKLDFTKIRLSFLIGLPTEKNEDIVLLGNLIQKCVEAVSSGTDVQLTVYIAPFIPKPFSPFQWEGMESRQKLEDKYETLRQQLPNVSFHFENVDKSMLRAILRRGNRCLCDVVESAWLAGSTTQFIDNDFAIWEKTLEDSGLRYENMLKPISTTVPLPWDHIGYGISKYQLKSQRLKAFQAQIDSALSDYVHLGNGMPRGKFEKLFKNIELTPTNKVEQPAEQKMVSESPATVQYGRKVHKQIKPAAAVKKKIRVQYAKIGSARFISHLDVGRIFEVAARKASLSLVYSQGKSPHPKFSFGPPLPIGITSIAEYIDLEVELREESDIQTMNLYLPDGMKIVQDKIIFAKVPALSAIINVADYQINLSDTNLSEELISNWMNSTEIWVDRQVKEEVQKLNIRPYVDEMRIENNQLKIRTRIIEGKMVRVNELVDSLCTPGEIDPFFFAIQRVGQFVEKDGEINTPFDVI